jgi:hypothetical protein
VSATRTDTLLADGQASASALTGGYHLAFWIGASLVLAALVVTVAVIQAPKQVAQEVVAHGTEHEYSEAV